MSHQPANFGGSWPANLWKSLKVENTLKGNAQFLCNLQKSSVNVCLMKILKSPVTKKVIMYFYNLGEENFQK